MAKQKQDGFPAVFAGLKRNFEPDAATLTVTNDGGGGYSLDAPPLAATPKGHPDSLFFGSVVINKKSIYHLMPAYTSSPISWRTSRPRCTSGCGENRASTSRSSVRC